MMTQQEIDRTQDWLQRMEYNEMKREMRGRCDTGTYSCDCDCGDSKTLNSAMVAAAWHNDHARDGHRPEVTWMGWKSH